MPVVDYEGAWFSLKAHIASKRSHGAGELAEEMARIEIGHRLPEQQQGFDDRPLPVHEGRESRSADGEPVPIGSGAS